MPPAPELAKLSRPRLYRVSARERVFRVLDELREYPLVWVTGPPWAGKSSPVASWPEARKLASIWYHIDPGDADTATFAERATVAAGFEEIPAGITVVALSRGDPPAEFARFAVARPVG